MTCFFFQDTANLIGRMIVNNDTITLNLLWNETLGRWACGANSSSSDLLGFSGRRVIPNTNLFSPQMTRRYGALMAITRRTVDKVLRDDFRTRNAVLSLLDLSEVAVFRRRGFDIFSKKEIERIVKSF